MHCEFDRYVMLLCICTAVLIEAWLEFWLTAVQRLALAYCPCWGLSFGCMTGDC